MTIYTVDLKWSGDGGDFNTSDEGKKFEISFTEGYGITHSPDATKFEILSASGLPQPGSLVLGTNSCYCKGRRFRRASPIYSEVEIAYSGETSSDGQSDPTGNPAIIKFRSQSTQEEIDEDIDGKPIVTKAGEPLTGVTEEIWDQVASIQKKFRFINLPAIQVYSRATNSDTFLNFAPGLAKIKEYNADPVFDNRGGYWDVSCQVIFRYPYNTTAEKAWYRRVRHEGTRHMVGGKAVPIPDGYGGDVTTPVSLKLDGTVEPDGTIGHWLEFKTRYALPFNVLGFN